MNEIILNGVSSSTISGLIITELPPVTKPKIRVNTEEIDGRDGDIITRLGYSAYDKTFTIGLSYGYDVNQIIKYFSSSGTVIFSNENTKYYNYQILEQIDFDKLIRFKTATVTMHVQPFKYSATETTLTFSTGLLSIPTYSEDISGISLSAGNEAIAIDGTASADAEFYIPIDELELPVGEYTLNAYASGTNSNLCEIRLINGTPTDENSFGGGSITPIGDTNVYISETLESVKSFDYIYVKIPDESAVNFGVNVSLVKIGERTVNVTNSGNYISRPTMTVYGAGNIRLGIDNNQVFNINLGTDGYITISGSEMQATKNGILKNRLVLGDYENFILSPGVNQISFSGDVIELEINEYSRWL